MIWSEGDPGMDDRKRHVKLVAIDCMNAALAEERMPEIPPERYEEVLSEVAHAAVGYVGAGISLVQLPLSDGGVPPFPKDLVEHYLDHLRSDAEKAIEEGVIDEWDGSSL